LISVTNIFRVKWASTIMLARNSALKIPAAAVQEDVSMYPVALIPMKSDVAPTKHAVEIDMTITGMICWNENLFHVYFFEGLSFMNDKMITRATKTSAMAKPLSMKSGDSKAWNAGEPRLLDLICAATASAIRAPPTRSNSA